MENRKIKMYKVNFLSQMILGEINKKDVKSELDKQIYEEFEYLNVDEKYLQVEILKNEISRNIN